MRKVIRVLKYVGYDIMDLSALAILIALGMLAASRISPTVNLTGQGTTILAFAVIGFIPTAVLLSYVKICRMHRRSAWVYFVNVMNDRVEDDIEEETEEEETSEATIEEETPLHEVSMDEENIDEDQPFEE